MHSLTTDFPANQLATFMAAQRRFRRATGLVAELLNLDMGERLGAAEVIAVSRPGQPHAPLWWINPARDGRVVVTELPSGAEHVEGTIAAALEWVASIETGEMA